VSIRERLSRIVRGRTPGATGEPRALYEFSRSLALIVDGRELYATVAVRLQEVFGFRHVGVFLRDGDGAPFRAAAWRGSGPPASPDAAIAAEGPLAQWLRVNETVLVLADDRGVLDFLDPDERSLLVRLGAVACVPLIAFNQLTGFLTVGATTGAGGYALDRSQRELLGTLTAQAALAFANAALLREQKARLKRLLRAERLATAGELAAGAAHEIRNPLTAIRSAVQYMGSDYEPGSDRAALAAEVLREVDRIDGILSGLLSFGRTPQVRPEQVDLHTLLTRSAALIESRARGQGVRIDLQSVGPLLLRADPNLLKQVLLNVFLNALQAMPAGGVLAIETEARGSSLVVRTSDTGCGIPPQHLERVFDPFFSTKPDGSGLGLSICYGIVERHGGDMTVTSEQGAGTTVTITLPVRSR
jgi:signal transduction histidine kinase